jgi:hypothetical protein
MAGSWRRQVASVCAVACALVAALTATSAPAAWNCGAPLQPSCPPSAPADASGALPVDTQLLPLPAPVRGAPLFPRPGGHLASGFNVWVGPGGLSTSERQQVQRGFGGTIARFPVNWPYTQARPGGPYDWRASDDLYRAYVAAGTRPILELVASPNWAVVDPTACDFYLSRGAQSQQECDIGPDNAHIGSFDAFAVAVARRYPLAAAIEIWNEPNWEGYWKGRDPYAYATLAASATAAIKASAPAMRVLVGALANARDDGPKWTAMATFVSVLRDRGVLAAADGLSFHPYPGTLAEPGFIGAFDALAATLPAGSDIRLVADEIGAPSGTFTAAQQRDILVKEYRELDGADPSLPWAGSVDALLFNTDIDPDHRFGFVDRTLLGTLSPRPVFCAMASILGGSGMCGSTPLAVRSRARHRRAVRRHPRRYRAMRIAVHAFSRNVPPRPARRITWAMAADGG